MKSLRAKPYKENPQTLGDHLRKRRLELGLLQKDAAKTLNVNAWTYLGWEVDRTKPTVRLLARIIAFLGYDPLPTEDGLPGALKAKRRALGLSQAAIALRLGLDEGTLRRYERGERRPKERSLTLIWEQLNLKGE